MEQMYGHGTQQDSMLAAPPDENPNKLNFQLQSPLINVALPRIHVAI
jgi:hypothetical protein